MTDDQALIEALRTAGHVDAADSLRDKQLAGQLREAGHDALANGTTPAAPAAQATDQPPTEREAGQAMLDQMRRQGIIKDEEEN